MAVNISSADFRSQLQQGSNSAQFAPTKEMGQAEFLLLLTTQLRNQDPSKPVDPSSFVTDLTQMSQLESTNNMNESIAAMAAGFRSMQTMQAASLMGKKVQVEGTQISHTSGQDTSMNLSSDKPLSDVKVVISDNNGVVEELDVGNLSSGKSLVTWDGMDDSGVVMDSGQFDIIVYGTDANGEKQSINTVVPSKVKGVSIEKDGTTILTLATGQKIAMSEVKEISL